MDPNNYFESQEKIFKRKNTNFEKQKGKKNEVEDDSFELLLKGDNDQFEEEKIEEIPEKDMKEIIKWRKFNKMIKICSEKRKDLPSIEFNSPIITASHESPKLKEEEFQIKEQDFRRDLSSIEEIKN
jgi:hypothetical protein